MDTTRMRLSAGRSQLIAMLNEPHGACVAALLAELASLYPRALYFPFQVSCRHMPSRGLS